VNEGQIETTKDECHRCGYDLRWIGNESACPECGLLAERSRRVTDEFVAGVASGLFLLWSLYLLARFVVAFYLASRALQRKWVSHDRSLNV
jgi:ribosomal protein S27AE